MIVLFSKLKISMFILLFFIVSKSLYAVEKTGKIYLGVGVSGLINNEDNIKGIPSYYEEGDWGETKNNINFFLGYNITKSLALELEYNQGIKNKESDSDTDISYIPNIGLSSIASSSKANYESTALFYNVVIKRIFLKRHTYFAKFGLGYTNATNKVDGNYHIISENSSDNYSFRAKKEEKGISYKIGIGYEFAITKNHAILVDYNYIMTPNTKTYFNDSNGQNNNTKDTESYSKLGFAYKFVL